MSGKKARELRKAGLDRKGPVAQNLKMVNLFNPKSPTAKLDLTPDDRYIIEHILDAQLLGDDGYIKIMPNVFYDNIPHEALVYWAGSMGYYNLPTIELLEWLKNEIGDMSAIEICAGVGPLGKALGIPRSDWRIYDRFPAAGLTHDLYGQGWMSRPLIASDVEDLEASEAVVKYKPQVVFGCYVTQRTYMGSSILSQGSAYGVEEELILKHVRKYIVFGTTTSHGKKKIKKYPHKIIKLPFLRSRAINPDDNAVFIWENKNPIPLDEEQVQKGISEVHQVAAKEEIALRSQTGGGRIFRQNK